MTKETATRVHELLMAAADTIDKSVAVVQSEGSDTDLREYRLGAGYVLDALMEQLLKRVYREYPDLIPPELDRKYLRL